MTDSRLTIGLLWHSVNSGNMGVGALTAAHLTMLDEVVRRCGVTADYVIIGWADDGPPYVACDDLTTVPIRLTDFAPFTGGIWRASRRCDVVFDIGLGDSFTDIYGAKRFVTQALSKLLVVATRTPLVLSPQTIGPFSGRLNEVVVRRILRSSRRVCTRDELSTEYVRGLDPSIEVVESTDLAMTLPFEGGGRSTDDRKLRIGFNVSGLLMAAAGGRSNRFGLSLDYPQFVRRSIRTMLERPGTEVHLVAHVLADENSTDDDNRWCRALADEFPEVVLAPQPTSPQDVKSYIAGLDAFVGARMHACIAAFSAGVPVLPVAYSRKFAGLFRTLGYAALIDARSDDASTADRRRDEFLDDLAAHRGHLAAARSEADRRIALYRQTVTGLLEDLAADRSPRRPHR